MVFQSLTLLSMKQTRLSWKPLGALSNADLKVTPPHFDPNLLFVLKEQEVSQFVKFTVNSQLIPSFQLAKIDLTVIPQEDVKLPEWSDELPNQLPWVPESFTKFSRPLTQADGSTLRAVVITSTARSIR